FDVGDFHGLLAFLLESQIGEVSGDGYPIAGWRAVARVVWQPQDQWLIFPPGPGLRIRQNRLGYDPGRWGRNPGHDLLEDNLSGAIQHAHAKMVHASVEAEFRSVPDDDPVDRLLAAQVNFPPGVVLKVGLSIGISLIIPDGIAVHSA